MIYIYCLAVIIFCMYTFIIFNFYYGWKKIKPYNNNERNTLPVSIVIPFRNEEENIGNIIRDILNQNYPGNQIELILLDDHSVDESKAKIESIEDRNHIIKVFKLTHSKGKKKAIKEGIDRSSHDLIITTDADCRMDKYWLSTIVSFYLQNKPKVIIGPVLFKNDEGIFSKLQSIEFSSLIASSAGAVGIKKPIMANGANLIFKKELYYEIFHKLKNDKASGDDVFLIHEAKKNYKNDIMFLKSVEATVYTKPQKTIKEFIDQRCRWAGKAILYQDFFAIIVSITVFLINTFIILFIISGIYSNKNFLAAIILYLLKSITDYPLLYNFCSFFKTRKILRWFIPAQLIYPFYIFGITFLSFIPGTNWKGRKI